MPDPSADARARLGRHLRVPTSHLAALSDDVVAQLLTDLAAGRRLITMPGDVLRAARGGPPADERPV